MTGVPPLGGTPGYAGAQMTTPLLSINGIRAVYNHSVVALSAVSVTVGLGSIVALLGANGAGKTTTLRATANLLPAERGRIAAGSITFDGQDVLAAAPGALVRSGLVSVLEGRHCFKSLSVEENLITGAAGRGSNRRETSADLERVYDLFPRLKTKRRISSGLTSGGEQQMTAIGRALMARPRLLVLDEPSMGLAPLVIEEIFKTLSRLNKEEGLTIFLAEQNAAIALRFAHRATVIENGHSVLEDTAAALRARSDIKAFYLGKADLHAVPEAREPSASVPA